MTYTGDVSPGGPPDVRELTDLTITKVSVGTMDNNAYLLRCRTTGEQLLIDAADEAERLLELVGDGGLSTVVTTHQHHDHWFALAEVVTATGARSIAHPADADALPVVDATVEDGQTVTVGQCHAGGHPPRRAHARGRSRCSTATRPAPRTCSPATRCSPAASATPGNAANFASLINDVEHKLFDRLPDETWFYPGHGKDSTLGAERPALPEWRARGW